MPERKRAYRYLVTAVGGKDVGAKVGEHVIDWKYLGKEYTWNIVGPPSFETTAWFTGAYVDRGYKLDDGTYKTDAEISRVTA